jgi:hypothetical protein
VVGLLGVNQIVLFWLLTIALAYIVLSSLWNYVKGNPPFTPDPDFWTRRWAIEAGWDIVFAAVALAALWLWLF